MPENRHNYGCKYSYIHVRRPEKQLIPKQIGDAEDEYMNICTILKQRVFGETNDFWINTTPFSK